MSGENDECASPASHWVGIDLEQVSALETFINKGGAEGGYEIECSEEREYGESHRGEQRGQWRRWVEERSDNEPRCDRYERDEEHIGQRSRC